MHTHVVTTTTAKLNEELDAWGVWDEQHTKHFSLHHVGARDWVIVIRHSEDHHRNGDEPRWNPELRRDPDSPPAWFLTVWDALTHNRLINFEGAEVPRWLTRFLESELATGTATGSTLRPGGGAGDDTGR